MTRQKNSKLWLIPRQKGLHILIPLMLWDKRSTLNKNSLLFVKEMNAEEWEVQTILDQLQEIDRKIIELSIELYLKTIQREIILTNQFIERCTDQIWINSNIAINLVGKTKEIYLEYKPRIRRIISQAKTWYKSIMMLEKNTQDINSNNI